MKTLHLSRENGENARIQLSEIPTTLSKPILLNSKKENTKTEKLHRGTIYGSFEPKNLIYGDPEIDFENIGRILPETSRGYCLPGQKTLTSNFQLFVTTYAPNGEEKDKKLLQKRKANTNDTFPVKIGKRMPVSEVFKKFCFHNQYLLSHQDGLEFQFLYQIAKELHEKKEVAALGAGPKGQAPLVFIEGGNPTHAFLYGEIQGEEYRLRILTTRQELKLPETPKDSVNL